MNIKDIFDDLDERDFIDYGKCIPTKVFESYWGHYEPAGSKRGWIWMGKWATLKERIEKEGFFTTSKGFPPGSLKILPVEAMPQRAKSKIKTLQKRAKRTSCSVQHARIDDLDEYERAKMHHVLNLTNLYTQQIKSILHDL